MALQTNVLRHGEWVTETVDLQAVLKANASPASKPPRQRVAQPPNYGILTKTAVESPVAHWILPVRLRSAQHMDVAIIGDHYVQISELGRDGRLRDVIRKTDFGARIRNAKVIGAPPESATDDEKDDEHVDIKTEEGVSLNSYDSDSATGDVAMGGTGTIPPAATAARHRLPPQQLLIVLESGDCIFLFIRPGTANHHEFVSTQYQPHGHRIVQPGFHAAVDPSSRYMALACPEDLFVVYELESSRNLNHAHVRGESPRPIKTFRPRAVQGVIHKMEFLFPHPDDDYHIILLLIIVRNGKSRMVTYEWEAGDDLASVLMEEKKGQPLPPRHQMPLLIIPLTLHSAFFAISAGHIGVCKDALNLPAEFDVFTMEVQETSRFHHGRGVPLWAAWTRPYRLPTYNTTRDSIYLAREDGVVMFLDIDSDNILGASVEIGKFDCNIGTSFCSLFDDFNDILIMGGDSGPGTIWQIRPRQPNIQLGTIPNWSPVADFVTTDEFTTFDRLVGAKGNAIVPWKDQSTGTFTSPDRIFATSGRGVTGAVTEFRYGLRANIGLDIDYETPVKQSWIFTVRNEDFDIGFHMLISLVDKSVALYLSADLTQASQFEDTALYDLASRTVAAAQLSEDVVIQVTENCLVFASASRSVQHLHSDTFHEPQVTVVDACISGNLATVSTHVGSLFQIHLLQLQIDGTVTAIKTFDQTGDVTCLCLASVRDSPCIVAGILRDGDPYLAIYHVTENADATPLVIDLGSDAMSRLQSLHTRRVVAQAANPFEALSSVVLLPQEDNTAAIVFGTRGGDVATLTLDGSGRPIAASSEKVGLTATHVATVDDSYIGKSVLVVCDGRISLQSGLDASKATFRSMHMVWVVDAADSSKPPPFINAASVLYSGLPGRQDKTQLVFSSKSRVMLAELHPQPGPVQRSLPVNGTPVKVLYSHALDCLVVAIRDLKNRATLQFLDPDSGEDLSLPADRNGEPVEFVSGLGRPGDQILGLGEWHYEREGDKWVFLLVSSKDGRFLVLSTARTETRPDGRRAKIKYWTRYKRSGLLNPVYSVVGWGENVFYCVGSTIYWDKLELVEKRLKNHGKFELASFATSLRIVNRKIVALTDHDSLEIIDIMEGNAGDMTLHHGDSESRSAAHVIEIGSGLADGKLDTSVVLVCDRNSTVAGLWVPWRQPGKSCSVVFEADLPASVRKLVRGRTRPSWQQARRDVRYGLVPSTPDAADILGVCLDGSLQHFTLLSMPIWRILRLVQNLALASPILYPFTYEELDQDFDEELETDQRSVMQVDGDMLQRCLDRRALEELFIGPAHVTRLFALLDKLDNGRWTTGFKERGPDVEAQNDGEDRGRGENEQALDEKKGEYFALLYDILEYYLAPVM